MLWKTYVCFCLYSLRFRWFSLLRTGVCLVKPFARSFIQFKFLHIFSRESSNSTKSKIWTILFSDRNLRNFLSNKFFSWQNILIWWKIMRCHGNGNETRTDISTAIRSLKTFFVFFFRLLLSSAYSLYEWSSIVKKSNF